MTGTLFRTSTDKLRLELGWDPLTTRRKIHRLTLFWQLSTRTAIPDYIKQALPRPRHTDTVRTLRNSNTLTIPENRTSRFQRSFFPETTRSWNKLPQTIRSQNSLATFKKDITALMGVNQPPNYFSFGSKPGNKLHTQLRLGNSDLNAHQYRIQKTPNPSCACGYKLETTLHFTLFCPQYAQLRQTLLQDISTELNADFTHFTTKDKYDTLIHGKDLGTSSRRVAQIFQNFLLRTNRL